MAHRRWLTGGLLLLSACGVAAPAPAQDAASRAPHVVLVVSDTHRWGAMSFTATPQVRTPNLEQLAGMGSPSIATTSIFRSARRIAHCC